MNHDMPSAVHPQPVPEDAELDHAALYFNRELSWLDFNWRVFAQARDSSLPLLERVRFLGIAASNLDEFVQKRVGGLLRQEAANVKSVSLDGRRPSGVLALVRDAAHEMAAAIDRVWTEELRPLLAREAGIRVLEYQDLSPAQIHQLTLHFREHYYPILTPLTVDPGHPFPFISNLSLSLAIEMRDPRSRALHFARAKVPLRDGRWIRVPSDDASLDFVAAEEMVRRNIGELFRGMEIIHVHAFRVTRNADVERAEEEAEDLLAIISEELRERRLAPVVRLEVESAMPEHIRALLLKELELGEEDLVEINGELAHRDCVELTYVDMPEHLYEPWEAVIPQPFAPPEGDGSTDRDIFRAIRDGDVLVHHPYESFSGTVQRLVEAAAEDPAVLAIKQTLYRTSDRSPIVEALLRAAERGKQVAVMVEVKARFDEQNNIEWAKILENAGIHVTYGLLGLKTHAKVLLIVREEHGHPRAYCHIGTGNYHVDNARVYTDLGLITCDPEIGADVVNLFHFVTGYAPDQRYSRLMVAPSAMRSEFERLIDREIEVARGGGVARIVAKMNALDDPAIIRRLYEASRAGVRIDLIVRGHCCLRPGLPGFSDNIHVRSIIGRFLEHDRVYYFEGGGNPEIFIGSADWRSRNLDTRVEALVPIDDEALRVRLTGILETALADNGLAWNLGPDGRYRRCRPEGDQPEVRLHFHLMRDAVERKERAHAAAAATSDRGSASPAPSAAGYPTEGPAKPRPKGKARSA